MLRVGLTGGIATGKTTVGQMFIELGCHLIDSDEIAHQLFEPGQDVHSKVVKAFGARIVAAEGTIDRKILGDIVFKDPAARAKLNPYQRRSTSRTGRKAEASSGTSTHMRSWSVTTNGHRSPSGTRSAGAW